MPTAMYLCGFDALPLLTGIPIEKVSSDESQKLIKMEETLHNRVIGQEEAVVAISRAIRRARVGERHKLALVHQNPTVVCAQKAVLGLNASANLAVFTVVEHPALVQNIALSCLVTQCIFSSFTLEHPCHISWCVNASPMFTLNIAERKDTVLCNVEYGNPAYVYMTA